MGYRRNFSLRYLRHVILRIFGFSTRNLAASTAGGAATYCRLARERRGGFCAWPKNETQNLPTFPWDGGDDLGWSQNDGEESKLRHSSGRVDRNLARWKWIQIQAHGRDRIQRGALGGKKIPWGLIFWTKNSHQQWESQLVTWVFHERWWRINPMQTTTAWMVLKPSKDNGIYGCNLNWWTPDWFLPSTVPIPSGRYSSQLMSFVNQFGADITVLQRIPALSGENFT